MRRQAESAALSGETGSQPGPVLLTVAIQAGGASRRMGQDKALLPFLGRPLIDRVIERLATLASELLVITNRPAEYAFLGVPLYPDRLPGTGPLGGLYSSFYYASHPLVTAVACDMPFVSPALLAAAGRRLLEAGADAAVPRSAFGLEPLHAVYRRETCLPAALAALEAGQRRFTDFLETVLTIEIEEGEILKYDPQQRAFLNLNTPAEFQSAEVIAAQDAADSRIADA